MVKGVASSNYISKCKVLCGRWTIRTKLPFHPFGLFGPNHLNTRFLGARKGVFGFETYQVLYTFSGGDKRVIGFEAYQYLYKYVGGGKDVFGFKLYQRCYRIWIVLLVVQVCGGGKSVFRIEPYEYIYKFLALKKVFSDLTHISSYSSLWEWKRWFWIRIISVVVQVCEGGEDVLVSNHLSTSFVGVVNCN